MTEDKIKERLIELRKNLEQIQANGNAVVGAIQECERWLEIIKQSNTDLV